MSREPLQPDLDPDELERLLPASGGRSEPTGTGRRGDTTLRTTEEPLRPWSAGEILDVSLDVFRDRFVLIVGTCILLWFPLRLTMPFIAPHTWFDIESSEMMLGSFALLLGWYLVSGVVGTVCEAVTSLLTMATLEGRELRLGDAFRAVGRRVVPVLVLSLLYTIFLVMGVCCLIVPGVLLAWKLWCARPALLIEGLSLGASFRRSFELTAGTFWRWLAVASTRFVFGGLLGFMVSTPDDPDYRAFLLRALPISGTTLDVINVFVSSIVIGTVTALSAVILTVFYVDCRLRRDGHDLDLQLDRIEQREGAAAGPDPRSEPGLGGAAEGAR